MALHAQFPKSPHEIPDPAHRWFPADEAVREKGYEKLLPPLVFKLRREVHNWCAQGYEGASDTSKALLNWWFQTDHHQESADGNIRLFQYYFAQREAVETIIYLYDVVEVDSPLDLLKYDSSGAISTGMFEESWLRFVTKMATGSGKPKVLSLVLAWCFFHKTYEPESRLARNFLVIAPNIIVLDRLRADFDGLRIFFTDPVLPNNEFEGRNWRDDFQLTLHIKDDVSLTQSTGNIFLTNIHRVYEGKDHTPDFDDENVTDYFLGKRAVASTTAGQVDVGDIVRDIDEIVILNDEAHHIHDGRLAWFKSIQDIHNRLLQKGSALSLQIDVTATPKKENGVIFVQTISDYPLVEAIHQDVVKHPVLPDSASRAKLSEQTSVKFSERYRDYIHLGYLEWRKASEVHTRMGKKAVFFIMTDDTKSCDEVAEYLSKKYPEFGDKNSVLVIHTKNNGEISEKVSGKKEEELQKLRKAANNIDESASPHKAIVSVLMLKEGWDVKNVTTIVGLRAYTATSNILPEQTLGRGLRRMYRDTDVDELVSVVGTDAFMDFVESIQSEGVELEYRKMGQKTNANAPVVIEVDKENVKKDVDKLDIEIPILTPRVYREYKNLSELDVSSFDHKKITLKQFSEEETREIAFKDIASGDITHKTIFDLNVTPDYRSVVGFFVQQIMRGLRLVSGYDILYGHVKDFIQNYLFEKPVVLEEPVILRNLSELDATKTVMETFKKKINELTVRDRGEAEIREYIKVSRSRPFVVKDQSFTIPTKSVFNKIVGDGHYELEFAAFLDGCGDIISFAKNYFAVNFKIDYQDADGNISNYYPDFLVKSSEKEMYVVETKGREDLDDAKKIKRLEQWCEDVNAQKDGNTYKMLYVPQDEWDALQKKPGSFGEAAQLFEDSRPATDK